MTHFMLPSLRKKFIFITFIIFCLTIPEILYALASDQQKPLHIVADSSYFNNSIGKSVFTGNVKITQGTTILTANKVVIYASKKHKVKELIAYGSAKKRAHYITLPKPKQPLFKAQAITIKYFPQKHLAYLLKDAVASQKPNIIKGDIITYNTQTQTVNSSAQQHHRTTIVLYPNKLPKTGKTNDNK